jgi:nitroreductase
MFHDLARQNRSYRRFRQTPRPDEGDLRELVDLARLAASGGNAQPLRYIISTDDETNARIFPSLAWAGHLKEWPGPAEGERPTAYVIILCDKEVAKAPGCDHGIAAQNILLGAVEKGLGGCMLGAIQRDRLRAALAIPERYDIALVVALGKPSEAVCVDGIGEGADTRYWRDAESVHHVPKRRLDDIIIRSYAPGR